MTKVRITIDVTYDLHELDSSVTSEQGLEDALQRWVSFELLMNPESRPMQMAAGSGWVMSAHSVEIKETHGT